MHLNIRLKSNGNVDLPLQYNHLVQSAIYNNIDHNLADFLHEQGFRGNGRKFPLFTFSRLTGDYKMGIQKGFIRFQDDLRLTISSPVEEFCQSIANGLLSKGFMRLGQTDVMIESIQIRQYVATEESIVFKTLSPVTVYSTFFRPEGRKYTCYFQPGDPDFCELVEKNLRKKYLALYGNEAPSSQLRLKSIGLVRQHVLNYKNTVIKGYSGKLEFSGPVELLQIGLDAGLGSKNAQGFGCVVPKE